MGFLGEGVTNAAVTWQEPRATAAPKGHFLQRIGWPYNPIIRDGGRAHPQSTSWHGLTLRQSGESLQRSAYALLAGVLNLLV